MPCLSQRDWVLVLPALLLLSAAALKRRDSHGLLGRGDRATRLDSGAAPLGVHHLPGLLARQRATIVNRGGNATDATGRRGRPAPSSRTGCNRTRRQRAIYQAHFVSVDATAASTDARPRDCVPAGTVAGAVAPEVVGHQGHLRGGHSSAIVFVHYHKTGYALAHTLLRTFARPLHYKKGADVGARRATPHSTVFGRRPHYCNVHVEPGRIHIMTAPDLHDCDPATTFAPGTKVVHYLRDAARMALSSYLYHTQVRWHHDPPPCPAFKAP